MAPPYSSKLSQKNLHNHGLLSKEDGQDVEEVRNLVVMLIANLSDAVRTISQSIEDHDPDKAKSEIHRIKAGLSFYNMEPLKKGLIELERAMELGAAYSELQNCVSDLVMLKVKTVKELKSDFKIQ